MLRIAGDCDQRLSGGFLTSLQILLPSLILSISLSVVTGYAMAIWRVRWANALLFTMFICAFVIRSSSASFVNGFTR